MSPLLLRQPLLTLVPPVLVLSSHLTVDFPLSQPQLSCGRRIFFPFSHEDKDGDIAQPLLPDVGCGVWNTGCGMWGVGHGMWGVGCCPHKPLVSCWRSQHRDHLHGTADPGGSGCRSTGLESWLSQGFDANLSHLAELLVSSASGPVKLGQVTEGFFRCCSLNP